MRTSQLQRALNSVSPDEAHFFAGVITARGKFYLGSSPRGAGVRYTPSISVELSAPDVPLLDLLFGAPQERGYYGKTTFRWVVQDRASIQDLCDFLDPYLPPRLARIAAALSVFCAADLPSEQASAFNAFRAISSMT